MGSLGSEALGDEVEASFKSLLTPLIMLIALPLTGLATYGVSDGEGRAIVESDLSEEVGQLLISSFARTLTLATVKTFASDPALSAPTTALTRTAGAGAAVPGSCQLAVMAPDEDLL